MNATVKAIIGAMGFAKVNTKPCANCKHSGRTIDDKVLACFYWNAFTKPDGPESPCNKWEAK